MSPSIVITRPSHSLVTKHTYSLVVAVVLVYANKEAFSCEPIEGAAEA